MSLADHDWPDSIDTSAHSLVQDFFEPALARAVRYDRGVGFFSAGWLRINAKGMSSFAGNSGHARWIISPILSERDWQALELGAAARADSVLRDILKNNLASLEKSLEEETLSALAWLIADGVLDFKLALPHSKLDGEFHDKFGMFADVQGQAIAFHGSPNESIQGTRNYESIMIFCSWRPEKHRVQSYAERFERLWTNTDHNLRVYELPEAVREHIVKLRTQDRPYKDPNWDKLRLLQEERAAYRILEPLRPRVPRHIQLRDYQEEAIDSWFAHNCKGLLEMATGTGKTITALAASAKLYDREEKLAVVIAVPYQHLVDQWREEAEAFGYRPILAYQSKVRWLDDLNGQIIELNGGYRPFISVITTHTTFISEEFQASIGRLTGPSLFIADEAHHLGAERSRQSYPLHIPYRLALSATPDRWFDDVGTAALRHYFGETVFAFPLENAIGVSLTPYYYYPHLVSLTDEEMERYEELSTKIARLMSREEEEVQEALKMLLIRRADLLNKAENKLETLSELVDKEKDIDHALFYCASGQIDDVLRLLGWEKGLMVHRFTAEEGAQERQRLLTDFANGDLQGLVAMKCLDEGVDVPSTRTAFILASSSNPREFVQRRGRILRKASGKEFSVIHDLIAVPPDWWISSASPGIRESEKGILRRELQRFKEFANTARNKHEAIDVIWDLASTYGLLDF